MAQGKNFNDMVSRIVSDLGQRTDLQQTVIPNAINDAIEAYAKQRFRFNENQPIAPFQITMVPGQSVYSGTDDTRIPKIYKIDYIIYPMGSVYMPIERATPEEVYLALQAPQTQAGMPELFAYDGQSLVFYPAPPASPAYVLTIGGYLAVAGPTDLANDTTNVWMNKAERLIRSRAKYEIALHVTRNKDMIAMMSPDEGSGGACERYFAELLGETNKVKATSRIRAMKF